MLLGFAFLFLLIGCGREMAPSTQSEKVKEDAKTAIEEQTQLEGFVGEAEYQNMFQKPEMSVHIYIDTTGYEIGDRKQAFFSAQHLPEEFFVYEKNTDTLVYTGKIQGVSTDEATGNQMAKGDFSAVTKEGIYFLQAERIGRSYSFVIKDEIYEKQLSELSEDFINMESGRLLAQMTQMEQEKLTSSFLTLLFANELFSNAFSEEFATKVYEMGQTLEAIYNQNSWEKDYGYSACMSGLSLLANNVGLTSESSYYRREAQSSFRTFDKAHGQQESYEEQRHMAISALYKLTPNTTYHSQLKDYFKQPLPDTYSGFFTKVFYITVPKNVDVDSGLTLMNGLISDCATLSDQADKSCLGFWEEDAKDEEAFFLHAQKLALADYAIVSQEYREIYKQQLHFISFEGSPDSTDMDLFSMAGRLFLLGSLQGGIAYE